MQHTSKNGCGKPSPSCSSHSILIRFSWGCLARALHGNNNFRLAGCHCKNHRSYWTAMIIQQGLMSQRSATATTQLQTFQFWRSSMVRKLALTHQLDSLCIILLLYYSTIALFYSCNIVILDCSTIVSFYYCIVLLLYYRNIVLDKKVMPNSLRNRSQNLC